MIIWITCTILISLTVYFLTRSFYINEIKKLTIIDKKTGIYTKKYFDEVYITEFHRARRIKHPIALIFIKSDSSIEVAQKLLESIQRDTDFIANYDDNIYVSVLYDTDSNGTDKVVQRIMESRPEEHNINMGVYAGIPDKHLSSQYMIKEGIKALEKSIKLGNNKIEFSLNSV